MHKNNTLNCIVIMKETLCHEKFPQMKGCCRWDEVPAILCMLTILGGFIYSGLIHWHFLPMPRIVEPSPFVLKVRRGIFAAFDAVWDVVAIFTKPDGAQSPLLQWLSWPMDALIGDQNK